MGPALRKFALTAHVAVSVGWLGAVLGFLALARHYWVLFKLLINVFASIVLLMYMRTLDYFAGVAAGGTTSSADLLVLRSPSPAIHAGGAVLLLVVATTLAIYKPRGVTPYGLRKARE